MADDASLVDLVPESLLLAAPLLELDEEDELELDPDPDPWSVV